MHDTERYLGDCPIERTLNLIGGKWKTVILWHLGINGILRYGELKRRMPNITERMFSRQLKELHAAGLIDRKEYPQVPPKVEYLLTEKGQNLMPILNMMCAWGINNTPNNARNQCKLSTNLNFRSM